MNKAITFCTYARNIFATLLHEMGSSGPTTENAQLNRQNDFSFT